MIIKSILLKNIRSYKSPPPIQLDTGITLFEGDIGSGKSTILSAIEFGLFGLGDQQSSYLLRHGEKEGSVLLEFEVNDETYQVYRALNRKRKTISQKKGYIVEKGMRTEYSVTEMKNRILQILNFNESPRPKTSSLIYRYAVFTPQEMMKEVLLQPVERRLETLRRAFRIEDYSIIINNTSILLSWIRTEIKFLEKQTQNIAEEREQLDQEKTRLEEFNINLKKISASLSSLQEEQLRLSKKLEDLQPQKEKLNRLDAEIPIAKKAIQDKTTQLDNITSRIEKLQKQMDEIIDAENMLTSLSPEYEEYSTKKARRDQLEPTIKQIDKLNTDKAGLEKALEKERNHLEKRISALKEEIEKEEEKISKQKEETSKIFELEQEEKTLSAEIEQMPTLSDELISLNKKHAAIEQEIKNKKEQTEALEHEFDELRKIGVGAPCPKCKQELTQEHYSKVEEACLSDLETIRAKIEEKEAQEQENREAINQAEKRKKVLEETEKKLNKLRQTLSGLKLQEANIQQNEEALNGKRGELEDNHKSFNENTFGESERHQIKGIESQLKELMPTKEEYDQIRERIRVLEQSKIDERYLNNKAKLNNKEVVSQDLLQSKQQKADLNAKIEVEKADLQKKIDEFEQEKPVLETIEKLDKEKGEVEKRKNDKNAELVGVRKDVEHSKREISRIEGNIQEMEGHLFRRDELQQYKLWISEYFIQAIKEIETNVLTSINTKFNLLFQKWISYLLETGEITVRVDGNFTPIIEQDGYEMDVESLSGGEKTSVALAYRLALNVMVKEICEAMHSNLLILDEPTDGFSRQQLFRLRDILKELNCEQVIAVSHESELESFVDKIFRISKEAGESKISSS